MTYLPVVTSFIRQLNEDIGTHHLQQGMKDCVNRSQTTIQTRGLTKRAIGTLRTCPTIVLANHPYAIEPIVLLSVLPARNGTKLIVNSEYYSLCSQLDPYLIPVYIHHHMKTHNRFDLLRFVMQNIHPVTQFSAAIEKNLNKHAMQLAENHVSSGGQLVLFPGESSPEKPWHTGIGQIIARLKQADASLFFCTISHTSPFDYLRLLPSLSRFLPAIEITFSESISIAAHLGNNPKQITHDLEQEYRAWRSSVR